MQKVRIKLVPLGGNPGAFDHERVKRYKSSLFTVSQVDMAPYLPEMDGEMWNHSCESLSKIVRNGNECDFTVGITGHMLDDNYYIRRLGNSACVMSYFELTDVIRSAGNTLENFILRNIYELVSIYKECNESLADGDRSFVHDDTRGCIYDMNGYKPNIVYSMDKPIICDQCLARLRQKSLSSGWIDSIQSEIAKIRAPAYNRIVKFIKSHPWLSFLIGSVWATVLNLIAGAIYGQF